MADPKPENTLVISHWAHLFEAVHVAPVELYFLIEQCVTNREVPECQASRVIWHEGGVFSAKREYLRLNRGEIDFYICAAPYGSGYFVSARLTTPEAKIPWAGIFLGAIGFIALGFYLFTSLGLSGALISGGVALAVLMLVINRNKLTFYKIDTALMFHKAVHQAVMEAVDKMTTTAGLTPLSETERKPVMHELFR